MCGGTILATPIRLASHIRFQDRLFFIPPRELKGGGSYIPPGPCVLDRSAPAGV